MVAIPCVPKAPALGPDVELSLVGGQELLVVDLEDGCLIYITNAFLSDDKGKYLKTEKISGG